MSSWLVQWSNRRWPAPRAAQNDADVATAASCLKRAITSPDSLKVLELGMSSSTSALGSVFSFDYFRRRNRVGGLGSGSATISNR